MKKIICTIIVFAFLANVSAQLKVDATGRVGIGTTDSLYKLNVNGDTRVTGGIYLGGSTSGLIATTGGVPVTFKVNGFLAGNTGNSGDINVSFGYRTLYSNTTGDYNTAIGWNVLYSNTTGNYNTANGAQALFRNIGGNNNTANGFRALYSNIDGDKNTANGFRALYSNIDGDKNTANGESALYSNIDGNHNTAIGWSALYSNTHGSYNTAIGGGMALYSNTEGNYNTANGWNALYSNTRGSHNTANGRSALYSNTEGSYNTANGNSALVSNITGNYNTVIGYVADVNATGLSNATAIGYNALATSSNQVRIGNNYVNSIGGHVVWTTFSDKRTKKNIRPDVPGLAFINRLQPVTFNLDLDAIDGLLKIDRTKKRPDEKELSPELAEINRKAREAKERVKQTGFIAEDVEDTAKSIGYDFSGVDVDEAGIYGLRYAEFVVPLVKAVQELSDHNNRLQTQNDRLQAQVDELSAIVRQLSGKAGNANNFNKTGGE